MTFRKIEMLLMAFIVVLLTGILVFFLVDPFGNKRFENSTGLETSDQYHVNADKINADLISTDINVVFDDTLSSNEIVVDVLGKNGDRIIVSENNSTLEIKEKNKNSWFNFNWNGGMKVTIKVSSQLFSEIDIETVSGNIELENVLVQNLELSTVSGEIEGFQVTAINSKLESVSGDLELFIKGEFNKIKFDSVSGNVDAKVEVDCVDLNVSTVSGNTNNSINACSTYQIDADTISGDITIKK